MAAAIASMAARSDRDDVLAVRQFAQRAGRQGFEGGPDGEDVADFLGVQVADRQPAARAGGQQTFLLQLPQGLAEGAAADLQHLGQFGFHQVAARLQLAAGDGGAQRGQRLLAEALLFQSQQGCGCSRPSDSFLNVSGQLFTVAC